MNKKILKNKKSQITIFIIIGVILVATAGLLFYFLGQKGQVPNEQLEQVAEEVPNQVRPVKQFVEDCITQVSKEAILAMGQHGGYIDPWNREYAPKKFENDISRPFESDGVQFDERESSFIPYYWYLQSPTDCTNCRATNQNAPRKADIENQLNKYVDENLRDCLANFVSFQGQGFQIEPKGPIKTETVLTQNDVAIKTTYPLDVTVGGTTTSVTEYTIRQPVRLLQTLRLARNIASGESQITFLEYALINLIGVYSGGSPKMLPPFSHTEEGFTKKIWLKTVAEQKVKQLLTTYTPMFRLNKTENKPYIGASKLEKAAYNSMNINIPMESEDMTAQFYYFGWPIHFQITPNEGEILTAYDSMRQNLLMAAPITMQKYKFFYDISWPVIVELRNENDFFGEGYSFMFAMEGNIKDNKNMRDFLLGRGTIGRYEPIVKMTVDDKGQYDDRYAGVQGFGEPAKTTLFCQDKQAIGSDVHLEIKSTDPNTKIKKAIISFGCGMHASCDLREASFDDTVNKTVFDGKVPICVGGGYISVEVPGHKKKYLAKLTTLPNTTINETIVLKKYYTVNVSFKKQTFTRNIIHIDPVDDWKGNYVTELEPAGVSELDDSDMVVLRVERMQEEDELFPEPTQVVIIDPENEIYRTTIEMVPGKYSLSANLFDKTKTVIQPQKRCYQKNAAGDCQAEASVPEDPMVMDVFVAGGIEIGEDLGYWRVDEAKLQTAKEMEVKLIQLPIPMLVEDLEESANLKNLTSENVVMLAPKMK